MRAPAPAWYAVDAGFSAVPAWLDLPAAGVPDHRVCLVGVAGQTERNAARQAIRQAVRAALPALFGVAPGAVGMHAVSGQAPYAMVGLGADARRVALAFSHDEALSLAAIDLDGPVGIDVMRIVEIPDWQALARDYLGPGQASALAAQASAERPAALARAWSEREARLKCLGRPIGEWQAGEEAALQACRCCALALPDGYVGTLAIARPGPDPQGRPGPSD
jgi:4'-phosphopantetheinyl transferase